MISFLSKYKVFVHLFIGVFLVFLAMPAHAESTDEIKVNWAADAGLAGSAAALLLTFELLQDQFAPSQCIWCQGNGMDDPITDSLSWPTPPYAAKTSDSLVFGIIPALSLGALALSSGLDGHIKNLGADALLVVQAVAINSLVNQFVKFGVGRARPFTVRDEPNMYKKRSDDNLSFYSGHTSTAFALVMSAGMIAHIRGYKAEPYIWGIGIPLSIFVAYTRIAAQKHYFSDVLIGAIMGSVIGLVIPWLHKNNTSKSHNSIGISYGAVSSGAEMFSISGEF